MSDLEQAEDELYQKLEELENDIQSTSGQRIWREERGCERVLEILNDDSKPVELQEQAWKVVMASVKLTEAERDSPKSECTDYVLDRGLLSIIAKELLFNPPRAEILDIALPCLTGLCLIPRHVSKVIDAGLVHLLVSAIEQHTPDIIGVFSLISLSNLAIHPSSHGALNEIKTIEVVEGLLELLDSEDESEMDCGLTAASILCRLSKDESGPSANAINSNPKVLEMLAWILNEVLVAGPNGLVLGSYWNPANVVLDVCILSKSPQNRPRMRSFVSLIADALQKRSKCNMRLILLAIESLENLYEDSVCRQAMLESFRDPLVKSLDKVLSYTELSEDTRSKVINLKQLLTSSKHGENPADKIPSGHTRYSWLPQPDNGDYCALGHTRFSWGV